MKKVTLVLLYIIFAIKCFAQPANDECYSAIPIKENVHYYGTNVSATGSLASTCGGGSDIYDVWYWFTPIYSAVYTISLCGSSFDTTLSLFDACDGNEIACNDDFCGLQSEISFHLDKQQTILIRIAGYNGQQGNFDLFVKNQSMIDINSPKNNDIVGGIVRFDGTIYDSEYLGNYYMWYRPSGGGWDYIDPLHIVFLSWVVNDTVAQWQTNPNPDGNYEVYILANDNSGGSDNKTLNLVIDNTPPIAIITSPASNSFSHGNVTIIGTANDAHLSSWVLQYTGGNSHGWVTIASGSSAVINNILGNWPTAGLPYGSYTLRLIVSDSSIVNSLWHNQSEYTATLNIGLRGDLDRDGDVDFSDLALLANMWLQKI